MPQFTKVHDITYQFKVSRRADGFKPLWDLEVKGPTDEEWIKVCEADHLSTCLGKVGFIFEQDGL